MSATFDDIKKRGAKQISEETHIPVQYVKALLESQFDAFSKVQFSGFISILEREYGVSLDELKEAGESYFSQEQLTPNSNGLFVVPEKKKRNRVLYISVSVLLVIGVIIFSMSSKGEPNSEENFTNDDLIESVVEEINESKDSEKPPLEQDSKEKNTTSAAQELNSTMETSTPIKEVVEESSFRIHPRSKLWLGYIDVETNKKRQTVTSKDLKLDPNKDWLLLFGHGYVDMYIDGELQKFDSRNYLRFLYKDGVLKHISVEEFKRFNRGRKW